MKLSNLKKLNGWQRLWVVGFIPWMIVNAWLYSENTNWLFGYWYWGSDAMAFMFGPARPVWWLVPLTVVAAFVLVLVPYIALYYLVKLSWRAALWVRTGFSPTE